MRKFLGMAALAWVLGAHPSWAADPTAYETTGGAGFGVINLATGVYTPIGQTLAGGTPVQLSGLGVYAGEIYGEEYRGSTLYRVDPATGALTAIAQHMVTGGLPTFLDTGSTLSGLYGLSSSGDLYAIDPTDGLVSRVGATGISVAGTVGMSANSATLYITQNNQLFSLNTATGAASLIGLEHPSNAFFGAMVTVDGVLYGGGESPRTVYSVEPSHAAITFIANQTGAPGGVYGFAPTTLNAGPGPSAAPEPATWSLLIAGFAGCGAWLRRRPTAARSAH